MWRRPERGLQEHVDIFTDSWSGPILWPVGLELMESQGVMLTDSKRLQFVIKSWLMTDCWYERQDKSLAVSLTFARIKSSEAALRLGAAQAYWKRLFVSWLESDSMCTWCPWFWLWPGILVACLRLRNVNNLSFRMKCSPRPACHTSQTCQRKTTFSPNCVPICCAQRFLEWDRWVQSRNPRSGDQFTFHAQTHTHDSSDTGSALKYTQAIKSVHTPAVSIGFISVTHSITAERLPESALQETRKTLK